VEYFHEYEKDLLITPSKFAQLIKGQEVRCAWTVRDLDGFEEKPPIRKAAFERTSRATRRS
jgi:hypothetical protein